MQLILTDLVSKSNHDNRKLVHRVDAITWCSSNHLLALALAEDFPVLVYSSSRFSSDV